MVHSVQCVSKLPQHVMTCQRLRLSVEWALPTVQLGLPSVGVVPSAMTMTKLLI